MFCLLCCPFRLALISQHPAHNHRGRGDGCVRGCASMWDACVRERVLSCCFVFHSPVKDAKLMDTAPPPPPLLHLCWSTSTYFGESCAWSLCGCKFWMRSYRLPWGLPVCQELPATVLSFFFRTTTTTAAAAYDELSDWWLNDDWATKRPRERERDGDRGREVCFILCYFQQLKRNEIRGITICSRCSAFPLTFLWPAPRFLFFAFPFDSWTCSFPIWLILVRCQMRWKLQIGKQQTEMPNVKYEKWKMGKWEMGNGQPRCWQRCCLPVGHDLWKLWWRQMEKCGK